LRPVPGMKHFSVTLALVLLGQLALANQNLETGQGFIDVPGGPVWYKIVGDGLGIPVIALHGGPGGTSCGYSLLEPLGDQRPVIRYDQLGTGRSGRPADLSLWRTERFVEALDMMLEALGAEKYHLLGHSWGGALAGAYVAEKGTSRLASVTFSSPLLSTAMWIADANMLRKSLPADVQDALTLHEEAGTTDSEEYKAASDMFYERHVRYGEPAEESEDCSDAPWNPIIYNYMWGPTEFRATGNLSDFDVTGSLGDIDVPVLYITGEFDEARPQTVARFQEMTPGAQFVVIKGVAHASLSRAPDTYRKTIEKFFDWVEDTDGE